MGKELSVAAIEYGSVIDHIPIGWGLKIVDFLRLNAHQKKVTLGLNLPSRSLGLKDIVKVEGRVLTDDEIQKIAILAPGSTLTLIENFQVVKKIKAKMPSRIEKIFKCPNRQCITNHDSLTTQFDVRAVSKRVELKCCYCQTWFSHDTH